MATWQAIVDQHGPLVWRLAYRLLGNEHDAADCYQSAFFQGFEASKRQTIDNWPGFLTRIVTTRAIDMLRIRYCHHSRDADTALQEATSPATADPQNIVQCRELMERFRVALTQLPAEHIQAFCLRYFEQLSNQEIATQLATNANRVAVLLHRTRVALQKHFDEILRAD